MTALSVFGPHKRDREASSKSASERLVPSPVCQFSILRRSDLMIIYGGSRTHVLTNAAPEQVCGTCGNQGTIDFHVFSSFVHLYLIPLFSAGKVGQSACRHCNSQLHEKEMPEKMRQALAPVKSSARTPLWQFTGVAILGAAIFSLRIVSSINPVAEDVPVPIPDYEQLERSEVPDEMQSEGSQRKAID